MHCATASPSLVTIFLIQKSLLVFNLSVTRAKMMEPFVTGIRRQVQYATMLMQ